MPPRKTQPRDADRITVAKIVAPPEPRWALLVMLFVGMGPLALPMLWRSPHFSRPSKVVLTVLVMVIFVVAVVILFYVTKWFLDRWAVLTAVLQFPSPSGRGLG
ncbi:MAG: hypothetical protein NTW96_04495 [Planctomycetia bacterium]|nr:hypothetical protein [Planctomycetia bacterium]